MKELKKAADSGELYTYHFNILRNILEKTASFHGFKHFSDCLRKNEADGDDILHKRMLDLLSHGNYSLFNPIEMVDENKGHFRNILNNFLEDYKFNEKLFENINNIIKTFFIFSPLNKFYTFYNDFSMKKFIKYLYYILTLEIVLM